MRRLLITLAFTAAWLALPAATPAQAALTPTQFQLLDNVFTAYLPLAEPTVTRDERATARAACIALGTTDALLSALRRTCLADLKVAQAIDDVAACRGRTMCLLRARRARRAASALLLVTRPANRVVEAAMLGPACRFELRASSAIIRFMTEVRDIYALLERALRIRSAKLARRAERRFDALRSPDPRPVAQQRDDFRRNCAPPA